MFINPSVEVMRNILAIEVNLNVLIKYIDDFIYKIYILL